MFDLHCHASFSSDPAAFAALIQASKLEVLSVTVTPEEFLLTRELFAQIPYIHVAAGLHPWWIVADSNHAKLQAQQLCDVLKHTRFVGEIGLDFSFTHAQTKQVQLEACTQILTTCAAFGNKVISLHAVRATDRLLTMLEQTGCLQTCSCIIHWFSGSFETLQRAISLGCWFSVGEQMLATKRGRTYVQTIPQGKLLLETDLPAQHRTNPSVKTSTTNMAQSEFDELYSSLRSALTIIESLQSHHTKDSIKEASRDLLTY